jgi:hypothetical protein
MSLAVDELSVDEKSVDKKSVNEKSVDELSVDGLSPHHSNTEIWYTHRESLGEIK